MKEKKIKLMILTLLIAVLGVVGVSYAVWQLTRTQEGTNVITSGCFKITFTGQNDILLNNAYPISDEEGSALTPYTFTIKNECAAKANYVINLETISSGEKILSEEYLKASLQQSETNLFLDTLTSENENIEKVIPEASKAYKLYQGVLKENEEISFDLRLWMDNNTPTEESVMNAIYEGKITVTTSYKPTTGLENVMAEMSLENMGSPCAPSFGCDDIYVNNVYTQNGKYNIKKVVYQNIMNPYSNAVEIVDLSFAKDNSVLGYYVKEENENNYILYIQADGKIKVNPKASFYGNITKTGYIDSGWTDIPIGSIIEGTENWDTSLVTDMSYMFYANNHVNVDFSKFDTSNVTTMSHMFDNSYQEEDTKLQELDLTGLNTSNVTDMSWMFSYCNNLSTTINITNPNVENYESMFLGAATSDGAQITVNYTAETSDLVDRMIATKSANSNVVKGNLIS